MWIVCILPPPHGWPFDMRGELYILYADEQFLSTQRHCHSVSWHTGSHHIIIIFIRTSSPFFFLPWEKSKTFLGCHYFSFSTRSLDFLGWFSNTPLSAFGHLSRGPASCRAITRTIWSEWIQSGQSRLACSKIAIVCLFRMVDIYYYCAFIAYFAFQLISVFFPLSLGSLSSNNCLSLATLFDYYAIIV